MLMINLLSTFDRSQVLADNVPNVVSLACVVERLSHQLVQFILSEFSVSVQNLLRYRMCVC